MTNKGYQVKEYHCPVKRYCQTMDLKDNPKLIKEYIRCHSKPEAWPEIRAGIRSVGILEMEIYILGSRLFMIIETPLDFNWETAMDKLSHLPRQAEWEEKSFYQFNVRDSDFRANNSADRSRQSFR